MSNINFTVVRLAVREIYQIRHLYKEQITGLIDMIKRYDVTKDIPDEVINASVNKAIEIVFNEKI